MTERSEALAAAALEVSVFAVAGRVMANPTREAVSITAAEALALSWATLRFGEIAKEAALLVGHFQLPPTDNEARIARRKRLLAEQVRVLDEMLRGLDPARQEANPQAEGETS